jgi:hypothetical protein
MLQLAYCAPIRALSLPYAPRYSSSARNISASIFARADLMYKAFPVRRESGEFSNAISSAWITAVLVLTTKPDHLRQRPKVILWETGQG